MEIDVYVPESEIYQVSIDNVPAGEIFPQFIFEPPFMVWRTHDLIDIDLVQRIGAMIQDHDD